jgi:EAL domain-containing protein (putative c-di-GMP-specific phosphodiesterase class I)
MGVRLAIDDFGTGYSNLAYLRRLPLDELKLDGSFLRGLRSDDAADPVDVQLVGSIVALAHLLGLTVTAEGVETQAQVTILRELNCDAGQGTYLGCPADPADLGRLLDPI